MHLPALAEARSLQGSLAHLALAMSRCRTCGGPDGQHRVGCVVSIARADLIKAVHEWHRQAHGGDFETCEARECYACHPFVLPATGEIIRR